MALRRAYTPIGSAALLLILLALGSCGNTAPPTSPVTSLPTIPSEEDSDSPWVKCRELFTSSGDPKQDVGLLGRACAARNKQHPLTGIHEGQQTENDAVDRYTFAAAGSGKCYRVIGAGEQGVLDLDVQLIDPDGESVATDNSKTPYPMAPATEPVCLKKTGIYTVEVSVYRGSGHYAVQVWTN